MSINTERRYGGCSYIKGTLEDKTRCVEAIFPPREWHDHQCLRKRGFGPKGEYCKQHAKRATERASLKSDSLTRSGE